jgi:hypothetical protein
MDSLGNRVEFCKITTCPTAETLLLYLDTPLADEAMDEVSTHLSSCDFCGAELHLLSRFRPAGPILVGTVRMPWPLYQLAVDVFGTPGRIGKRAATGIYDRDHLKLIDA